MATIDINADTFQDTIANNQLVLIDFWADWCGPCKMFGPVYDKSSEKHSDVVHAKLNTDANQQLTETLGIQGIPTLMAFRDGIPVFNQAGALPAKSLEEVIAAVKGLDMEEIHRQLHKESTN